MEPLLTELSPDDLGVIGRPCQYAENGRVFAGTVLMSHNGKQTIEAVEPNGGHFTRANIVQAPQVTMGHWTLIDFTAQTTGYGRGANMVPAAPDRPDKIRK